MSTHEELIRRLQECFNTRQFDKGADLHTPGFHSHPVDGGWAAGLAAWRVLTARHPDIRVVAEDILVDGDKAAVRSVVSGIALPDGHRERPMLFEIFRFEDGRFAEMWGATTGFPASASPEEVVG